MLKILPLAALLTLASGCNSCRGTKAVSYVDAPTTLEAVRAKSHPPDVTVQVERITKTQSLGAGCGHSPACLIIVPILLAGALFPEQYDVATIVDHGNVVY